MSKKTWAIVIGVALIALVIGLTGNSPTTNTPATPAAEADGITTSVAPPRTGTPPTPPTVAVEVTTFTQGTYDVGTEPGEVSPGRYRTQGSDSTVFPFCSAAREKTDGSPIDIPETTNEGPATLTVRATDGQITFSGDCEWSKVETK